ncbi:unnamed protein product [Dibothriocephalus latus]|uniref:Uncharacterized protein n=1 Tax=Dibothriocephalus latus TaxID=60516 RepID=A0A3P7PX88_DIBLA|nr:unnamed protein product [Dibothriocephalus latus]
MLDIYTVVMNKVLLNTLLIIAMFFIACNGEAEIEAPGEGDTGKNTTTTIADSSVITAAQLDTASGVSALVLVQACFMSLPLVLLANR